MTFSTTPFSINGRQYHPPAQPTVVICLDGCSDDYLTVALDQGRMPNLTTMAETGYRGLVRAALPTFTNVNNACIVSGVPPSVTGICGNYFLDLESGEEVMMNAARYLRCQTILAAASKAGRKVAMLTAKDKLRELLSPGLQGIIFSAERAKEQVRGIPGLDHLAQEVGQKNIEIYSAEASLFVLRAGVALLEDAQADFLYLSLTDYIQHKYPPSAPESLDFLQSIDLHLGDLLELGAVIGVTADHGMNRKVRSDGKPNVIYLESELVDQFGEGIKVICPITDPYMVHHGALGSAVMIYLSEKLLLDELIRWLYQRDGVAEVWTRAQASISLELPSDRIGDLVVFSEQTVVMGRTPEYHDLDQLMGGLRSHGGRYEEVVPLILSEPTPLAENAKDPRNFDVFSYLCSGSSHKDEV